MKIPPSISTLQNGEFLKKLDADLYLLGVEMAVDQRPGKYSLIATVECVMKLNEKTGEINLDNISCKVATKRPAWQKDVRGVRLEEDGLKLAELPTQMKFEFQEPDGESVVVETTTEALEELAESL